MLDSLQDLYKTNLPYQQATVKDQMDYVSNLMEFLGYDTNGNMGLKMVEAMGYDNYGNPTLKAQETADKSNQDWTKLFGYDANGNLTFDAQKFVQEMGLKQQTAADKSNQEWTKLTLQQQKNEVDSWYKQQTVAQKWQDVGTRSMKAQADISQNAQKIAISQQNANLAVAKFNASLEQVNDKTQRQAYQDQMSSLKTQLSAAQKDMDNQTKIMQKYDQTTKEGQQAFEAYQKAEYKVNTITASMDALSQTGITSAISTATNKGTGAKTSSLTSSSLTPKTDALKNASSTTGSAPVLAENKAKELGLTKTSGLRTAEKNAEVGGSKTSAHLTGQAYDFAGSTAQMKNYAEWAASSGKYKQVIYAGKDWVSGKAAKGHEDHVHVSW